MSARASASYEIQVRQCYGPTHHVSSCRTSRPLCRWRRATGKEHRPCRCSAAHYPHRSGWCAKVGEVPQSVLKSRTYKVAV